jgi:hypothetical protein
MYSTFVPGTPDLHGRTGIHSSKVQSLVQRMNTVNQQLWTRKRAVKPDI